MKVFPFHRLRHVRSSCRNKNAERSDDHDALLGGYGDRERLLLFQLVQAEGLKDYVMAAEGGVGGKDAKRVGNRKKPKADGEGKTTSFGTVAGHSASVTYISMLGLLLFCPPFVIVLWYALVNGNGSIQSFWNLCQTQKFQAIAQIWPKPTVTAWKLIAGFGLFEAFLQLALPGKKFLGPVSPAGNRPIYKCNGMSSYVTTLLVYIGIWRLGWFNPAIVYDHLGEILSALIIGSFVFCILLYIKGHVAPSSSDSGTTGNFIADFYWGMELYPRIGKSFDIKTFTNCRFGMMSWAVLAISYCIKQYELYGKISDSMLVSTCLMLVYITKFFWWESGYWCTMDIAHDRAGFYICWGCLVWVPCVYTSPALYLVRHPNSLGIELALSILFAGLACIYMNYDCDRQRQHFRNTNGKCTIWGKPPSKIEASYVTEKGETKKSLLLTSGWWGLARHFHYLPEISAAFFWTVPALFQHLLPYFYVIFLTILLVDRAVRDDQRCRTKYTKYWETYCKAVPYKIVPGIY